MNKRNLHAAIAVALFCAAILGAKPVHRPWIAPAVPIMGMLFPNVCTISQYGITSNKL